MERIGAAICSFVSDERGVTAVEYAVLGGIISVLLLAGFGEMGKALNTFFQNTAKALAEHTP